MRTTSNSSGRKFSIQGRTKRSAKKRKTFKINQFGVASNDTVELLTMNAHMIASAVKLKKVKDYMSDKSVKLSPKKESNTINVSTVHMLNSNHVITELSPQADAYTKFTVIRKFLANGVYFGETDHPIPWQTDHLNCWRTDAANAVEAFTKIVI